MDDTSKTAAKVVPQDLPESSPGNKIPRGSEFSSTFVAFMDDSAKTATPDSPNKTEQVSTTAKALDRWFKERQKQDSQPRLLEIPNEALITGAGPLRITGNLTIVGEDGSVAYANHIDLCRCGRSRNKPNCDGQHLDAEFLHSGRMQEVSDAPASDRPAKITLSLNKDGPVTFRGRLRLHNSVGQECTKIRGALCRCGQSTNKPFCDGSHEKVGFRSRR
ncbi:MAG TPA: CDGSH iron-sulfur domain-containing protein [Xanthomonadales bacterium]|nr:CDGSH iron-sulfur domain-containing protein [Xanthomonadales bacterium]